MDFQSCDFNLSQENDVRIWIIISCCWKKNWKNGRNHQPHFKCFQVHLLLKSQLFDKHFTCAVALNIADLGSNNWGDWGLCRAQTITIATTCYHLDHWLKMYQMLVLQPSLIVNFMLRLEYLWVSWSLGGCKFPKKKKTPPRLLRSSHHLPSLRGICPPGGRTWEQRWLDTGESHYPPVGVWVVNFICF